MVELKQVTFPPQVLNRIAPDISLKRHLSIGLRPNLRNFSEVRSVSVSQGTIDGGSNVVGSSSLKCGSTMIICTITVGTVEVSRKDDILLASEQQDKHVSVHPVVEVARGRIGSPTDEEMILSQRLYETFLHSKIIPESSLAIDHGLSTVDEDGNTQIYYPDIHASEHEILRNSSYGRSKQYAFVLYAHLKVFSRTSPLFDLCYYSILKALQSVKLPRVYMGDQSMSVIPLNSRNKFAGPRGSSVNLNIDLNDNLKYALGLNESEFGVGSNFGVIKREPVAADLDGMEVDQETVLLADLEGESEENTITSKISIITNEKYIKSISLIGGGDPISKDMLKEAIRISKLRASSIDEN